MNPHLIFRNPETFPSDYEIKIVNTQFSKRKRILVSLSAWWKRTKNVRKLQEVLRNYTNVRTPIHMTAALILDLNWVVLQTQCVPYD